MPKSDVKVVCSAIRIKYRPRSLRHVFALGICPGRVRGLCSGTVKTRVTPSGPSRCKERAFSASYQERTCSNTRMTFLDGSRASTWAGSAGSVVTLGHLKWQRRLPSGAPHDAKPLENGIPNPKALTITSLGNLYCTTRELLLARQTATHTTQKPRISLEDVSAFRLDELAQTGQVIGGHFWHLRRQRNHAQRRESRTFEANAESPFRHCRAVRRLSLLRRCLMPQNTSLQVDMMICCILCFSQTLPGRSY